MVFPDIPSPVPAATRRDRMLSAAVTVAEPVAGKYAPI
jgi:hypothetical protein